MHLNIRNFILTPTENSNMKYSFCGKHIINYKEARKFEKENIKLYRTLGLSIGAMLAIFFI